MDTVILRKVRNGWFFAGLVEKRSPFDVNRIERFATWTQDRSKAQVFEADEIPFLVKLVKLEAFEAVTTNEEIK